ncbi:MULTISPECIES: patatin-like phospholipase family protein [unclassified Halorhodospira]|uniref:patatin-like phospholipase family protein n=1 Tax=unclassified Halorhodospira TaxID=2626748 RepID=UPI001EE79144|nr:patatin-like phospholipase family protein [Halorhodospira sp. M39old]MCG5546320.1 patatin-like phospholipase family protein [Halorhodospira sp. M38]
MPHDLPDRPRRHTLKMMISASLMPLVGMSVTPVAGARGGEVDRDGRPRIGLALGSGGARGLSHLLVFEALEELGVRPHRISGCSIGAIMGALYAAGLSAEEIRAGIDELVADQDENWLQTLMGGKWRQWLDFVQPSDRDGGLVESDAFIAHLRKETGVSRFGELEIPLQIVATDYWKREAVVFDSGALWPAVQASMAMPGLFSPVSYQDRVLVDGGLTNPVPFDLLAEDCDVVVAVNVLGTREEGKDEALRNPAYLDNIFNTFQVMQYSILQEKRRREEPDILISPAIRDIRVLDFHRVDTILEQARPEVDILRDELRERLAEW